MGLEQFAMFGAHVGDNMQVVHLGVLGPEGGSVLARATSGFGVLGQKHNRNLLYIVPSNKFVQKLIVISLALN